MNNEIQQSALDAFSTLTKLLPSMVFPILSLDKEEGLTVSQSLILIKLDECGACCLSQLAEAVVTSRQSMSVMTNDLMRKGYVRRTEDPVDQRKVVLVLTEAGQEIVNRRYRKAELVFQEFFIDFTEEQYALLGETSRKMIQILMQTNYEFGDTFKKEARELY